MGIRLTDCSGLQVSCYQNAEVTWISIGGAQLSGRAKSSSQLGTVNPTPQAPRQRYGGGLLSHLLAQYHLAHHSLSLGQGQDQNE